MRLIRRLAMLNYLRVFLTFARNSLVRDMTFRANFLIDTVSSIVLGVDEPGLLHADLPLHADASAPAAGWGKYQFFLFLATALLINSLVQALVHDQRRRVQRADPHRHARLRPAEADRHAVPRLAHADRLVVAGQLPGRAGADGLFAARSCTTCPGRADRALPALRGLRRGDLLQPDDRHGGHAACGWGGTRRCSTSGSTSPTSPATRWRSTTAPAARRCGWRSRSSSRCWWSVNVPARILVRPIQPELPSDWLLPCFTIFAAAASLAASRWVFQRALGSYRSASS